VRVERRARSLAGKCAGPRATLRGVSWTVYVLHSRRAARTYVGIALDHAARLRQHNGKLPGGARSTRAGRPWRVRKLYGPYTTRSEALKVEHAVKKLRGKQRFVWRAE